MIFRIHQLFIFDFPRKAILYFIILHSITAYFIAAMYSVFKKMLLRLFPERFLSRIEFILRFFYSLFYLGSAVRCNICGGRFSGFISLASGDLLCPRCGSLPRQRRLWILLQPYIHQENRMKILHFSPSRILQKKLRHKCTSQYVTTDYNAKAGTDKHYDITSIPESDESYGLIICFHVLEHIPDDRQAIRELYRILKPGGRVIIQTPFKDGDIFEDNTIITAAERLHHFGQEDHVRIYSTEGLVSRLKEAGFSVQVSQYEADPFPGLKEETILTGFKAKSHIFS
jgi:SAM-dependent methyltransferase